MENMDLTGIVSTGLAIILLATAAGLGLMRGVVTNLREQLADTRALSEEMRQERTDDRAEIDKLRTQLDALGAVVTGEVHWAAISEVLDQHHVEARQYWQHAEQTAESMLSALQQILERTKP